MSCGKLIYLKSNRKTIEIAAETPVIIGCSKTTVLLSLHALNYLNHNNGVLFLTIYYQVYSKKKKKNESFMESL